MGSARRIPIAYSSHGVSWPSSCAALDQDGLGAGQSAAVNSSLGVGNFRSWDRPRAPRPGITDFTPSTR